MANINAPAHDFAPPWLKIPSYSSSQRPSGADVSRGGHSSRREGHTFGFARPAKENDYYSFPRHNQQFNDSRHDKQAGSSKERKSYLSSYHHSLDFDDSQCDGRSTHSTNGDNGCNGTTSSSQSAFSRRPHSRHDFRNIPSSYIKGESSNRPLNNGTNLYYGRSKGKGRNLESGSSYNDNGGISVTSNNFNQEFPSLQGDVSEEPTACPPSVNGSVWEKPRNIKIHTAGNAKKIQLIKKPLASENGECSRKNSSLSSSSSSSSVLSSSGAASSTSNSHTVIITPVAKGSIYRALIPAKAATSKKTLLKEGNKVTPPPRRPPTITPPPTSNTMEILVKHPKAPGNKSEFLKALRNESKNTNQVTEANRSKADVTKGNASEPREAEKIHQNGIDIAKLSMDEEEDGETVLSSSLEAERRLLREMGWKEEASDDDNYAPLTEDEMREFRALSEQIAKNGFRRTMQTNISPKRLTPFSCVVTLPTESDTSSSDSDSDF